MDFLRMFDHNAKIPAFISKHQKLFDMLLTICCCIVMPVVSAVIATRGEERAIYKSLSYLAYTEGHMAIVYIWGLCFFAVFFFALTLILNTGCYSKAWKAVFLVFASISAVIMLAGISVPWLHVDGENAPKYDMLRKVHNIVSSLGFVLVFLTTAFLFLSTFARNTKQGVFSLGAVIYLLITAIVSMKEANIVPGPCGVSSIAQIYICCSILFLMLLQYVFMRVMPNERLLNEKRA